MNHSEFLGAIVGSIPPHPVACGSCLGPQINSKRGCYIQYSPRIQFSNDTTSFQFYGDTTAIRFCSVNHNDHAIRNRCCGMKPWLYRNSAFGTPNFADWVFSMGFCMSPCMGIFYFGVCFCEGGGVWGQFFFQDRGRVLAKIRIRISNGQVESFDCWSMAILLAPPNQLFRFPRCVIDILISCFTIQPNRDSQTQVTPSAAHQ